MLQLPGSVQLEISSQKPVLKVCACAARKVNLNTLTLAGRHWLLYGGPNTGKFALWWNDVCDTCPLGYYTNKPGMSACAACSAGHVGSQEGKCLPCARGKYSPGGPKQKCADCPVGRTSRIAEASSVAECQPFALGNTFAFIAHDQ